MYTYHITMRNLHEVILDYKYVDTFAYNHNLEFRLVSNAHEDSRYFFFSKSYDQLEKARNEMRNMIPAVIKEIRLDEVPVIPEHPRSCSYADLNL